MKDEDYYDYDEEEDDEDYIEEYAYIEDEQMWMIGRKKIIETSTPWPSVSPLC